MSHWSATALFAFYLFAGVAVFSVILAAVSKIKHKTEVSQIWIVVAMLCAIITLVPVAAGISDDRDFATEKKQNDRDFATEKMQQAAVNTYKVVGLSDLHFLDGDMVSYTVANRGNLRCIAHVDRTGTAYTIFYIGAPCSAQLLPK